jgi:hypothetical protein
MPERGSGWTRCSPTTAEEGTAFARLAADPGRIGLESLLAEIGKLERLRALALPPGLLRGLHPDLVRRFRRRAAVETAWELRRHPDRIRLPLLAFWCAPREAEVIDGLVELLIGITHRITVKAERRVLEELMEEAVAVRGKAGILFRVAEAAVGRPEGVVREVIFPAAGQGTLEALVREARALGAPQARRVHTAVRASYGSYYRRMMPRLLAALDFRSNNGAHRPLLGALEAALRREIHEGLNVVETWNSANGFIVFGKGGEVANNRLEPGGLGARPAPAAVLPGLREHADAAARAGRARLDGAHDAGRHPRPDPAGLGPRQPLRRLRPRPGAAAGHGWPRRGVRPATLYRTHSVKDVLSCSSDQQGIAAMPPEPPDGRKVKSGPAAAPTAADRHERARDYLSPGEVARLLDAAKAGRHGVRDHLLLLMTYRHGLRVSEAIGLRRDELDLDRARLWVRRLKGGLSVEQPIAGDELRAVRRYLATRADALPWLFVSERGQPLTRQAVNYLVRAAATRAGLRGVHPHTLRHSCGFALADRGHDLRLIQDYLGHRDPRHTVHYTRTAGRRFEGLWRR